VIVTNLDEYDVRVGSNVRKLRQARGLNQEELAAQVAERGLAFRQQTVVKIEKGQRPLRLREADAITAALEVDIDALVGEELVIDWATLLIRHTREVTEKWDTLMRVAKELLIAQGHLQHDLDSVKEKDIPIEDHILNEAATILQIDLVEVMRAVPKQLEAEHALEAADQEAGVTYIRHDEEADRG